MIWRLKWQDELATCSASSYLSQKIPCIYDKVLSNYLPHWAIFSLLMWFSIAPRQNRIHKLFAHQGFGDIQKSIMDKRLLCYLSHLSLPSNHFAISGIFLRIGRLVKMYCATIFNIASKSFEDKILSWNFFLDVLKLKIVFFLNCIYYIE